MAQSELTLELARLRDAVAEFNAQEQTRRKKTRHLAAIVLAFAGALLIFDLVLYLRDDPIYRSQGLALFSIAIALTLTGSGFMTIARTPGAGRGRPSTLAPPPEET
ncbi:MAG: hypothetical protein AB1508_02670 [Pseudomonadota bacterium]